MVAADTIRSRPIDSGLKIPTRECYMIRTALLLLVFTGTALSAELRPAPAPTEYDIQYTDLGRTSYEEFTLPKPGDRGEWRAGNILPEQPIGTQKSDVSLSGMTGVVTHDCSNREFKCLYGAFHVFAVPRSGLVDASTYAIAGAEFHVVQCLRTIGKHCQVALLSSQCLYQFGDDACRSDVESGYSVRGPVMYFTFNEDIGVTSYGFAPGILNTADAQFAAAGKLILSGNIGLLLK